MTEPRLDLPRTEIVQTVITIATALIAARDIPTAEATARAIEIIKEAVEAAETLEYEWS